MEMDQQLAALASSQGNKEAPALPLKESQRDELAVIRRAIEGKDRTPFKPWDEVTLIHRSGPWNASFVEGMVFVFITYMDAKEAAGWLEATKQQNHYLTFPRPDCLVAWIEKEGFVFSVADSLLLVKVKP